MKTLLNPTGGRPLKNEDAQLFEQFVTMFEGVFENIPAIGDFIISGCVISGSDISSGYIYYDGKICTFEGATGVSFPLAMERSTVTESTRTYFDTVAKDSISVEYIVAQVGGGFSFSSTTPRWEDYFARKATQTEGRTGTNDVTFMTSLRMLDALQNSSAFIASETNRGSIIIADETTARAGTNNIEAMTANRVLDAIRNGTPYAAQTTYKGVVEKATSSEGLAGTSNKFIDAAVLSTVISSTLTSFSYAANWGNAGLGTTGYSRQGGTGFVKFKGGVDNSVLSGAVSSTIATLPVGYRPDTNISFVVIHGTSSLGIIKVQTSGAVVFTTIDNYVTNNIIYIESVYFKL